MAMSQKSGGRGFLGLVSWRFIFVLLVSILIGQIADRHVRHGDGYSPSFFWVSQQGLLILAVLGRVCKSCLMDNAPTWR